MEKAPAYCRCLSIGLPDVPPLRLNRKEIEAFSVRPVQADIDRGVIALPSCTDPLEFSPWAKPGNPKLGNVSGLPLGLGRYVLVGFRFHGGSPFWLLGRNRSGHALRPAGIGRSPQRRPSRDRSHPEPRAAASRREHGEDGANPLVEVPARFRLAFKHVGAVSARLAGGEMGFP